MNIKISSHFQKKESDKELNPEKEKMTPATCSVHSILVFYFVRLLATAFYVNISVVNEKKMQLFAIQRFANGHCYKLKNSNKVKSSQPKITIINYYFPAKQ